MDSSVGGAQARCLRADSHADVVDSDGPSHCGHCGAVARSGYSHHRLRRLCWVQHNEVRLIPSLAPLNGPSQHAR